MSKPQFTDRDSHDWPLELDFPDLARIKKLTDVDLLAKTLPNFGENLGLLVDVMYAAWKDLADERGISDVEFGRLVSHCFEAAVAAFNEALADFFHRVGRRPMAEMLRAAMRLAPSQTKSIETKLDQNTLNKLLMKSMQVSEREIDLELAKAEAEMDAILGSESTNSQPSSESATSSPAAG